MKLYILSSCYDDYISTADRIHGVFSTYDFAFKFFKNKLQKKDFKKIPLESCDIRFGILYQAMNKDKDTWFTISEIEMDQFKSEGYVL